MDKTVFVIGAGASKEANLPLGSELKNEIARVLNFKKRGPASMFWPDEILGEAIRIYLRETQGAHAPIDPVMYDAQRIAAGLPYKNSIDDFIDSHRTNSNVELLGELGIVRSILGAELTSKLYVGEGLLDSPIFEQNIEKSWYLPFFRILTEGCTENDLDERFRKLAFIIFNYDRCIEHFIYHGLRKTYGVSSDRAAELISILDIYHPYGQVGKLPWQDHSQGYEFGHVPTGKDLLEIIKDIRTFSEGTDINLSEVELIRELVIKSSRLIFLGFAFHKLNMQLLQPLDLQSKPSNFRCYASTYGFSTHDVEAIKGDIREFFYSGESIRIESTRETCSEFMQIFQRSLSF